MAGSLRVVGCGIAVGVHLTREAEYHIASAEVLFSLTTGAEFTRLFSRVNPSATVIDLRERYSEQVDRSQTYEEMANAILEPVREGKRVCAVFYGHPAVFAFPSRRAVVLAKREGIDALMLPAVSADACLYADLLVDPAATGIQMYEANMLIHPLTTINPYCALMIWQLPLVGVTVAYTGSSASTHFETAKNKLMRFFGGKHRCISYTAATHPLFEPEIDHMTLEEVTVERLNPYSTLLVPPLPNDINQVNERRLHD